MVEKAQRLGGSEHFWYSSALTLADALLAEGGAGGETAVGAPGALGWGAWPEPHATADSLSSSGLPGVSETRRCLQGRAEGEA